MFAAGVGFGEPVPDFGVSPFSFAPLGVANAAVPEPIAVPALAAQRAPLDLLFVRHEAAEPDDAQFRAGREWGAWAHGRFAAPGNAVRRQVNLRSVTPRTADELAGFFRQASYTLGDVRQGEAVPPIRVERIPGDLGNKDGSERKALFITALLPVVLDANQRVLADRQQLIDLRDRIATRPMSVSAIERIWLEDLAQRYDVPPNDLDELLRRVDIVPPSMAIAQGGVESGWGTSPAARAGNSLYGQIQFVAKTGATMPQPFGSLAEATAAYVTNLNTHRAYAAFRSARASLRERGETLDGYQLIGALVRYSELGQEYIRFVRQIMRENDLSDFDRARLSIF